MQTQQTQNSFPGLKRYWNFQETGPLAEKILCKLLHIAHSGLKASFSVCLFVSF